jgi:ATP-dependent Clp protease ATP-binding subunit ClpC
MTFSPNVKQIIVLSRIEAVRLDSAYLGCEHLFLGFLNLEEDPAIQLVKKLVSEIQLKELKSKIDNLVIEAYDRPFPTSQENISLTFAAEHILKLTGKEAMKTGKQEIEPVHLLLALINPEYKEEDGTLMSLFRSYGLLYPAMHKLYTESIKG